jgi:hypothetical protein
MPDAGINWLLNTEIKVYTVVPSRPLHIELGVRPRRNQFYLQQSKKKFIVTNFSYFVDNPRSVAQGGKGVVVSGCPACNKRNNTTAQFLDHLANDVMPALIGSSRCQSVLFARRILFSVCSRW